MKREHLMALMLCLALGSCGEDGEDPAGDGGADGAADGSADGDADGNGVGTADGDADGSGDGDGGGPGDGSADGDAGEPGDGSADGDAGEPGDGSADGDAGGGDATTFARVYQIIASNCSPCHTANNSGNLDMSSKASAYDELVGQEAQGSQCGESGRVRVVPEDAAGSLIIQKLRGIDLCGARMPFGRDSLPNGLIEEIEEWIEAGALDN